MDDMDSAARACARARQMLDGGANPGDVLNHLVNAAEAIAGDAAVSSILVLDAQGLLRNGASPNLPDDYLAAIDGLKPDPLVGTCAAAAATGAIVFTPDFCADEKWAELRHLPMALGFVAAWSMPIRSSRTGHVLGTFGTYFRALRTPSAAEVRALDLLAGMAAQALETNSEP